MQIISTGDNMHKMPKPIFPEKLSFYFLLAAHRVVKVNIDSKIM